MLFNSVEFLLFFVLVFILYYALSARYRLWLLLVASCLFYARFIPAYLLILFATILIDYFAAIYIENDTRQSAKKWHLTMGIVNTCLVLFVFKYYNFFVDNYNFLASYAGISGINKWDIILPIGLSFHTFQSLSYVIEVYRGHQVAERHLPTYALYVMFFPQLVAGPIERAANMLPQLQRNNNPFLFENIKIGFTRFVWGLFKKVVVADTLALYVDAVYTNWPLHSGPTLLLATYMFAFQIYCDFSGYSDMALGAARMLGYRMTENFSLPYFSKTVTEFWRRWHISLSSWLRDYLYISFGGNRYGLLNTYRNLLLTMLIGGLWHGASWNFVIWGGLNGLFLSLEKWGNIPNWAWRRNFFTKVIGIFITFHLICLTWVFFRANTFEQAVGIIRRIVQMTDWPQLKLLDSSVFVNMLLGLLVLLTTEGVIWRRSSIDDFCHRRPIGLIVAFNVFFILLLLLFGNKTGSQFIYFQF